MPVVFSFSVGSELFFVFILCVFLINTKQKIHGVLIFNHIFSVARVYSAFRLNDTRAKRELRRKKRKLFDLQKVYLWFVALVIFGSALHTDLLIVTGLFAH